MVAADVSATVRNHKITDIKILRHKNERGQRAEVIPQRVLAAQSLKVDTVSGATNSSKVILKAIENALESKIRCFQSIKLGGIFTDNKTYRGEVIE